MKLEQSCCFLSMCSYYDEPKLRESLPSEYTQIQFHSSSVDAQCFTSQSDKKLYIVFRGTESTRDWLSDANMIRVPMDLQKYTDQRPLVHWGFLRQFRSLQANIETDIHQYHQTLAETDTSTFIITGHSLGAAQCYLAALYFSFLFPESHVICYSYGSPRVGNRCFVDLFTSHIKEHKRFVNDDDPVTMLPMAIRFAPLPNMYYIDKQGQIHTDQRENRWWSILKSVCLLVLSKNTIYNPIHDHSCSCYYEKLSH